MNCPQCHHENPGTALFCLKCGASLPKSQPAGPPPAAAEEARSIGNLPTLRNRPWQPGDKLMDRYRVLGELGRGGMGVVYKCLDELGGIQVALKALPPELSHNTGEMEEVKENFQLVSKLVHQHIAAVKTLERDPQGGNYYLILELAEGMDLRKWRKERGGKVPLEKAAPILRQVAQALDYAHSLRIIHRDIKPGNVMVSAEGAVKVLDFGLAAQIQTSMARVSQTHFSTSGTGPYMSPEQWRGQRQDGTSDQYALAVMAYELLVGYVPFESPDQYALRESVIRETPQRPEGLSDQSWSALARSLSKDATQRFESCAAFVAALEGRETRAAGAFATVPSLSAPGRRSKIPLVIAGVVLLALLGGAIWYFGREWPEQKRQQAEQASQAAAEAQAKTEALAQAKAKAVAEQQAQQQQSQQQQQAQQEQEREKQAAVEKARAEAEAKAKADAEAQAKAEAARQERERLANARGALFVDTEPGGATIDLGGQGMQTSPAHFQHLPLGKLVLNISKEGYDPVKQEVEVKENEIADPGKIKLVRQTGSVTITSTPAGAVVIQDGQEIGTTPLTLPYVPTGDVSYNLRLARHKEIALSGTVAARHELALTATMEKTYPTLAGAFTNSLGMPFVPVPGTAVLFGAWDVRVQDYRAYAAANSGVNADWQKPGFAQGDTHPVVKVSWNDAQKFCAWLTEKERQAGYIDWNQSYRLPKDAEWSAAAGLNESQSGTPQEKDGQIRDEYPWGQSWPPPHGAGNYGPGLRVDEYPNTSPPGSFPANRYGLYDMGGNVWQWCEDYYDIQTGSRALRGASWTDNSPDRALLSYRHSTGSGSRDGHCGFRCVLVAGP